MAAALAVPEGSTLGDFPATISAADGAAARVSSLVPGSYYLRYCPTGDGRARLDRVFRFTPADPGPVAVAGVAPEVVARLAVAQIRPPAPRIGSAPPLRLDAVVGVATWLWVDRAQWRPLRATAAAGGLSVTATVTPVKVTWDMGEGHHRAPEVCAGPGTPYRFGVPDRYQHTTCSYVYRWASFDHRADDRAGEHPDDRYHGSATITWSVAWQAGDGRAGTLADLHTSTPFVLRVDEIQAIECGTAPLGHCAAER